MTMIAARTIVVLGLLTLVPGCGPDAGERVDEPPTDGLVRLTAEQRATSGIEVAPAVHERVVPPLRVPGTLAPPDTAVTALGSIVEGQVGQVHVVTGETVAAGDPLLRIHSHELTAALRERDGARARLAYGRAALERSETLLAAGAVAREEVERRRADFEDLQAEVAGSESWVDHLHPSDDGHVVVVAPRAGSVFRVHVGPGSSVVPGSPLVELGRTDLLWATGFVPEAQAASVRPEATLQVEAGGTLVPARLVSVGGIVDPVRRAVEVRGELESVPTGVRPGMFVTLHLMAGAAESRVVLPADAVQRMPEGDTVFLERDPGAFEPLAVDALFLGDGRAAVRGIPEGAQVVTRGAYVLRSMTEGIEVDD